MRGNRLVFLWTLLLSLLSLYYLSFTWVDWRIQRQAAKQATAMAPSGQMDLDQVQAQLRKLWKQPVYRFLGSSYTYEEVKERSLKLGLDLQGGMQVTMELCPLELVKALATHPTDAAFLEALERAQAASASNASLSFAKQFTNAYHQLAPEGDLSAFFATETPTGRTPGLTSERAICQAIDREIESALERSVAILRARLDRFGASQPAIQRLPGTRRIQIELPGVKEPERMRKLLEGVAKLRFWQVATPAEFAPHWQAIQDCLRQETTHKGGSPAETAETEPLAYAVLTDNLVQRGQGTLSYPVELQERIDGILRRRAVQALLPPDLRLMWAKQANRLPNGQEVLALYAIKQTWDQKPLLEGSIVAHAEQILEAGRPEINMQMNGEGAAKWKFITAQNVGKQIAITLDDRVYTAPVVHQEIPNGHSKISGNFTLEEAKDLASVLQTGSLPARLKIVEEAIVGPSLGKMAQQQGLVATAVGLGLVLAFMALYYARAGTIANAALCFNLLFLLGILAQLDATLTLPGIAGLVLTIGMAIDANVLIFERIREELSQKVPLQNAIKRGYAKSYSSIIDSNITTFLVGAVLYYLGKGQVRGFALVLMVGIVSSCFSSICITQALFAWVLRKPNPTMHFGHGGARLLRQAQFNFLQRRFWFYAASCGYLALGGFCLYQQKGLPLGVDFSGGRSYVVRLAQPVDPAWLKSRLAAAFPEGIEVRTYGAQNVVQLTTNYLSQAHTTEADGAVQQQLGARLREALQEQEGGTEPLFTITSTTRVAASVAKDVQKSARQAVLFSLLGIFGYVALRFRKWQFGLAAILALVHDGCAVFAGFAIARTMGFGYEVNEVFLAAILTIIGYSINDTVVIFDRIRDRCSGQQAAMTPALVNRAINETLSRTLITSLTTLLVVVVLFLFGGEALKGFSFALMLGIVFGTYSSICIATTLLMDLLKQPAPAR